MVPAARSSLCTLGNPVDFYWLGCSERSRAIQVEQCVQALFAAVERPGTRGWNPYNKAILIAEFRDRVQQAANGNLKPRDEVKGVGDGSAKLWEIRWNGISVTELAGDGGPVRHMQVEVRMYHTEPDEVPYAAIGLHAHEKIIVSGDASETKRLQDAEIAVAERRFVAGRPSKWEIPQPLE